MLNIPSMLLGAVLVAIGVLAAALAERIRGPRITREAASRARTSRTPSVSAAIPVVEPVELFRMQPPVAKPHVPRPAPASAPKTEGGDDVIAALIATGYKKPIATEATWACSATERATLEGWTVAALRRCAQGARS
jgi:hypothetical protein